MSIGTEVTFGLKKDRFGMKPFLLTTDNEWVPACFVGLGTTIGAKEWKTFRGASNAAKRFGGKVFTITETMNY